MSLTTVINYYNKAYKLYDKLNDAWSKLESGHGEDIEFEVEQLLSDLNFFEGLVRKIYIEDLRGNISPEQLSHVKHNKKLFRQGIFMMRRHAKGIKYADEIKGNVLNFLIKLNLPPHNYKKYATNEREFAKKLVGAMTHPDNILDLELKLKRIANGSISLKEFNSLILTYMKYIPHRKESDVSDKSFKSLRDYRSGERVESKKSWEERIERMKQDRKEAGIKDPPPNVKTPVKTPEVGIKDSPPNIKTWKTEKKKKNYAGFRIKK